MRLRLGLVGRYNNKGLGVFTRGCLEHLPIVKTLIKDRGTVPGSGPTWELPSQNVSTTRDPDTIAEDWLHDLDGVIVMESYGDGRFFQVARDRGIRTALMVNFEFLPKVMDILPDFFMCSSQTNYQAVSYDNRELIPYPVDRDKIPYRQRKQALTFLHAAGTLGLANGNCTDTFIEAIPLVRNKRIRFAVRSQVGLRFPDDPRLTLIRSPQHNWEGYEYGDVLVLPQRLRATSLPIQEAMCAGMPIITTRMPMTTGYPVTRIDPAYTHTLNNDNFKRPVTAYEIAPEKLAAAIDEMAETDISRASHIARTYSARWGWDVVGPQIKALFL